MPLPHSAYLETLPDDTNRYELIAGELFVLALPVYLTTGYSANLHTSFRYYLKLIQSAFSRLGAVLWFSDYVQ